MREYPQGLIWALKEDEEQILVKEWMLEEVDKTFHSFKSNRADRLPKEFFVTFWDQVGLDVLYAFKD